MLKPIPRRKLPHQATYKAYTGNLGEGDTYDTPITLTYVKIDDTKQIAITNNGREVIGNALMFYDYVNSTGLVQIPPQESIITFNNKDYHIVSVEILYGDDNIEHHYEVLLK